jgi:GNAT superfamily N-acetyltransferase
MLDTGRQMSRAIRRRLNSGDEVLVRPIRPEDKRGLREGIEGLAPQSRYRRFFTTTPALGAAQLRYLTEIDHHEHEALLAIDPQTRNGIAVARFVRSAEDPAVAEVAVAVTDAWQGRGLGTMLLHDLAGRAREEGIRRFSASVLAENETVLEMLRKLGGMHVTGQDHGVVELLMDLPEAGIPATLSHAVRAAARGEVSSTTPAAS